MIPERNAPAEFAFDAGFPLSIYPIIVGEGAEAHIRVTTPGIPFELCRTSRVLREFLRRPERTDPGQSGSPNAFFTNAVTVRAGPLVTDLARRLL